MKLKIFISKIKNRLLEDKFTAIILLIYLIFCSISCIHNLINIDIRNSIQSLLFMLFVPLLFIVEGIFKIKFPSLLVFLLYFLAIGGILGSAYNFYNIFPLFDSLLHFLSGIIFACIGFSFMELLIGKANNNRKFVACLLFAVSFSLTIAVIWEVFEYVINTFLGYDMMEDTIIFDFNSYLLSGTHNEYVEVNGIEKTIIYYESGKSLVLNGYLDIGLIDTIYDLIICAIGSILFSIYTCFGNFKYVKLNELLIPKLLNNCKDKV